MSAQFAPTYVSSIETRQLMFDRPTAGERLARQFERLRRRARRRRIVLWLCGGARVDIPQPEGVLVDHRGTTIRVPGPGGLREVFFEDLLAIELRS